MVALAKTYNLLAARRMTTSLCASGPASGILLRAPTDIEVGANHQAGCIFQGLDKILMNPPFLAIGGAGAANLHRLNLQQHRLAANYPAQDMSDWGRHESAPRRQ